MVLPGIHSRGGETGLASTAATSVARTRPAAVQRAPRRRYVARAMPAADATVLDDESAFAYCRSIAREVARTFYYGSLFLPREQRRATWALYAFCRTVDDIADEPALYPQPLRVLDTWRADLEAVYNGGEARGPVMRAWAAVLRRYPVPLQPALDLLDGVAMDARDTRFVTFGELRTYCYRVAGTVGLLMAPVLGCREDAALRSAVDLGIAMQLTNIVRDVGEDALHGRVYLPDAELAMFHLSRETLLAAGQAIAAGTPADARQTITPDFMALLEMQMCRAEDYYARGLAGLQALAPDCRLAIALSAHLYRGIHARVRANGYDVLTRRAHVPLPSKLAVLPGMWWQVCHAQGRAT